MYRNAFVGTTVGRYPLSFVVVIFRTGLPYYDGDQKIFGLMTLIFLRGTLGSDARSYLKQAQAKLSDDEE